MKRDLFLAQLVESADLRCAAEILLRVLYSAREAQRALTQPMASYQDQLPRGPRKNPNPPPLHAAERPLAELSAATESAHQSKLTNWLVKYSSPSRCATFLVDFYGDKGAFCPQHSIPR
jgi:hypothetical protein